MAPKEPKPELAAAALPAVKAAYLHLRNCGTPGRHGIIPGPAWVGIGMGIPYTSPDAEAHCNREFHQAPAWGCSCGFYAIGSLAELEQWRPVNGTAWELEVALWGRVIEHTEGYRAQRQRVLTARPPRYCDVCGAPNTPAAYLGTLPDGVVRGLCERHAIADRSAVVLAGELERTMGVPIDCAESFRTGPPPPDLGALLERLVIAVERGGLGGAGHTGPAFPREWGEFLTEAVGRYGSCQQWLIPTASPSNHFMVTVSPRADHLELRFQLNGVCHDVRLPYRTA